MSDIDFDELDRAVASVIEPKAPTATAVADAPASVAEPITVTTAAAPVTLAPAVVSAPVTTPAPAASAQALHAPIDRPAPRGRFFDMVQPSRTPSARPVERTSLSPDAARTNQTFVSDVIAGPSAVTKPAPAQPTAAPTPVTTPEAIQRPADEPKDFFAASPDDANPHKAPEVQASPFIPDAKVEKRPLGAFNPNVPPVSPTAGDSLSTQLLAIESEDRPPLEEPSATAPSSQAAPAPTPAILATPAAPEPAAPAISHSFNPADDLMTAPAKPTLPPAPAKPVKAKKLPKIRADKPAKYGRGTLIWVVVAIAVMLIGFGVGATLYFVVLQQ